jgi:hypothetical protein
MGIYMVILKYLFLSILLPSMAIGSGFDSVAYREQNEKKGGAGSQSSDDAQNRRLSESADGEDSP